MTERTLPCQSPRSVDQRVTCYQNKSFGCQTVSQNACCRQTLHSASVWTDWMMECVCMRSPFACVKLSICLCVCLPACLLACLSVYLSINLSIYLSVCMSVRPSVCRCVCLFVSLSVCSCCCCCCFFLCCFYCSWSPRATVSFLK